MHVEMEKSPINNTCPVVAQFEIFSLCASLCCIFYHFKKTPFCGNTLQQIALFFRYLLFVLWEKEGTQLFCVQQVKKVTGFMGHSVNAAHVTSTAVLL